MAKFNALCGCSGAGGKPRPGALSIHTDAGSCYLPSVPARAAQLNGSQESHKAGQNFFNSLFTKMLFLLPRFLSFYLWLSPASPLSLPLTPEQTGLYFLF